MTSSDLARTRTHTHTHTHTHTRKKLRPIFPDFFHRVPVFSSFPQFLSEGERERERERERGGEDERKKERNRRKREKQKREEFLLKESPREFVKLQKIQK